MATLVIANDVQASARRACSSAVPKATDAA